MQKLTTLPRLSPATSCSGSHSRLGSSTGNHSDTKIFEFKDDVKITTFHCFGYLQYLKLVCNSDTTALNVVISQKLSVAKITSTLCQFVIIMKFSDIRGFIGVRIFNMEHALLTSNHSFKMCGGPEAFTSTSICEKCGGKLA